MTTVLYVAAHKPYEVSPDAIYRPIHVGRARTDKDLGFAGDDTGRSISGKNANYCELTGLYWAAYNTEHDVVGLVHYRRYFRGAGWKGVASAQDVASWMRDADIVVPTQRNYLIESIRTHYSRAHHGSDLVAARAMVSQLAPDHLPAFDRVLSGRRLSLYNMFVMRGPILREYADWLFPILEAIEERIPVETYGPQQARVFGYLGERLFNVWLEHNSDHLQISRVPVRNLEGENLLKKAWGLIRRRFGRGRAV